MVMSADEYADVSGYCTVEELSISVTDSGVCDLRCTAVVVCKSEYLL